MNLLDSCQSFYFATGFHFYAGICSFFCLVFYGPGRCTGGITSCVAHLYFITPGGGMQLAVKIYGIQGMILKSRRAYFYAEIFSMQPIRGILLDGPPAIFFIGGFILLIAIPLVALILLIWYFIRQRKKNEKNRIS